MTETVGCVVVGAGVVGLACARALACAGVEVVVLERHGHIGEETSSRNSEVIHAGIYYPEGSLKALLCVAGKQRLYEYCERYQVPYRRCGKIIVASDPDQVHVLKGYQAKARANGVGELEWLDAEAVSRLEPAVSAVAGVRSPSTGIIDSHAFMLSLQGDLEKHGGVLALDVAVSRLEKAAGGAVLVHTPDLSLKANWVINCAGLAAPGLARQLDASAPRAYFARGHYYGYAGAPPFRQLVYPVAEPGGLGVHVTLDMAGQIKFGPDVEWTDEVDYRFDDSRRDRFVAAIRRYYPDLDESRLHPDYVGVRPKISPPDAAAADFRIDGPGQHGVAGLINLLGIESPGLTASLAIAERVAGLAGARAG